MERESFLEEGETVLEKARKHWIVYVEDVLTHTFGMLFFIAVLIALEKYGGVYGMYGAFGVTIVVMLFWIAYFYAWTQNYFDVWYITDKHIVVVDQKELLERKESFMNLNRIQDVSFDKVGLLQTWLGYGKLHVQSAGESQEFVMSNVCDVEVIARKIMDMRDIANGTKHV